MVTTLEEYYLKQPEPIQGCLLALKQLLLGIDEGITHERKYQIPFFYYRGYKLCFLWVDRKKLLLGFVEDRKLQPLVPGIKRRDKVETFVIDPVKDLPVEVILERVKGLMGVYESVRV